ncbi:MAG: hypothetical protein C5B53_04525 [Candidatus Melainabacteria bacterium]|nr:MAG: hypothetical protein C5B53_04525 [Candidatus Melainabacteria bacterium]
MVASFLSLSFILFISIALAILGLLLVRHYVDHQTLNSHHDVAGYLLSIVGTLYAVVLGLIVVGSLNTFDKARITVASEANALHNIFHLAQGLPSPTGEQLRSDCVIYAKTMIDDEWKSMEYGKSSQQAHAIIAAIWKMVIHFQPHNQDETDLHSSILAELNVLANNRHLRLTAAEPAYDWIIWSILIFGGVVLVVFTYFFGVEKLAVQILMTVLVTIALALNLFIVALFGYPYSGDVKVAPTPFEEDLYRFHQELKESNSENPAAKSPEVVKP